jgi:ArsR family transcriptional regulator
MGRASLFRLARPELQELLAAGEAVLAATGSAVALCPECGTGGGPGAPPAEAEADVADE